MRQSMRRGQRGRHDDAHERMEREEAGSEYKAGKGPRVMRCKAECRCEACRPAEVPIGRSLGREASGPGLPGAVGDVHEVAYLKKHKDDVS